MPKLSSHINPGRVLIATIGSGAMVALLASAALATNPGASASASMSASESASASKTAGNTVAGTTFKLPTGASLVAQCRVIENVNGVDKDNWTSTSTDKDDPASKGATADSDRDANGDKDDMTASPMASATVSPMATESASPTETPKATESATASASPSSAPSPIVLRGGESVAALDAACDKVTSSDKDDMHRATATASATASNKTGSDEESANPTAANKADPDDRNGLNGDDRNAGDGVNGHSDSHQGRGNSNR